MAVAFSSPTVRTTACSICAFRIPTGGRRSIAPLGAMGRQSCCPVSFARSARLHRSLPHARPIPFGLASSSTVSVSAANTDGLALWRGELFVADAASDQVLVFNAKQLSVSPRRTAPSLTARTWGGTRLRGSIATKAAIRTSSPRGKGPLPGALEENSQTCENHFLIIFHVGATRVQCTQRLSNKARSPASRHISRDRG